MNITESQKLFKEIKNPAGTKLDWVFEYKEVAGIKFKFDKNNRIIKKRIDTYFTKEPKTLEWINSFKKGEILVDIGANIGIYTLYAAKKGITVHAFEPHAGNFADLITNIYINEFDSVKAYPFAVMDKNSVDELAMLSIVPAQSHNDFGIEDDRVKHYVAGFKLDYMGINPHHIKIDVDGLEDKVIAGMNTSLENVKSILIEVTTLDTLKPLLDRGFKIDESMTYKLSDTEYNYILRK